MVLTVETKREALCKLKSGKSIMKTCNVRLEAFTVEKRYLGDFRQSNSIQLNVLIATF